MSLTTPVSVQKLQTALHAKAKGSPNYRFHALYDKVYRKDVLAHAYDRCKANASVNSWRSTPAAPSTHRCVAPVSSTGLCLGRLDPFSSSSIAQNVYPLCRCRHKG